MTHPTGADRSGDRRHHRARARAPEHDDPADRVRELHVAAPCSRRRVRCSPTSTPRATRRKRYYGGNFVVDEAENLARERACALFGAEHANVQPHSGANANQAAFMALLEPGDKVMGMRLDQGGHLTHGSPVNFSGRMYDFVAYGVDDDDRDARLRRDPRPRGARAPAHDHRRRHRVPAHHRLRGVPRDRRRGRARCCSSTPRTSPGSSPAARTRRRFRYADVVTFTTHKTLRGPRAGAILCRSEYAAAIDKAVFPGLQGGPLMHVIAAKAVAFHEASQPVVPPVRGRRRHQRGGARRRARRARASASCRAAPTTT